MKAKINDRSGGFWIEGQRRGYTVVVREMAPAAQFARLLGNELISSIKGGNQHKFNATFRHGKTHYHLFSSGRYSYGIQRKVSPDGEPYLPLKDATIKHRKWKASVGEIPTSRNRGFILRETGKKIFNAMSVSKATKSRRGLTRIEVTFDNPKVAGVQNEGTKTYVVTKWFGKMKRTKIPARPFIGIQKEFVKNFHSILRQL